MFGFALVFLLNKGYEQRGSSFLCAVSTFLSVFCYLFFFSKTYEVIVFVVTYVSGYGDTE